MPVLNWGLIHDGGILESMMHAILYAQDRQTILFGRPGKDAGQDARTADGHIVFQSKYRDGMDMDVAVDLALEELEKIKKYRAASHANYKHWKDATKWVLFANLSINPNDDGKWKGRVIPEFAKVGLAAEYWTKEIIEAKLAEESQVREVYFGQENRVLVGLKEAHDLLLNERLGSDSLDCPIHGRDADLARVKEFINSPEKRVLPVIGPGGIGKSRFLYESLVTLSQDGWRVLWGLPGAMVNSSQWFRLLNGPQKTCVALDDPDDPALLRAVIEQLSTAERRNWRVIISYRTDRSDVLRRYKTNNSVEEPIRLLPLSEPDSKALINSHLGSEANEAWLHRAFRLNQGNPGWISLFAELAKQGKLTELPTKADDIATLYVSSCLENLEESIRPQTRILLRWLALWGSLVIEAGREEREVIEFLEEKGISKDALHDLLKRLVKSGLVRNWGIAKRLFGIDSLLIRQHILSEWLLREEGAGEYSVSPAGTELVSKLLSSGLPRVEATLQTISQMSLSRLESQEAYSLLRPIFGAMTDTAKDTNLVGQIHIAELVAKLGTADPESALDVLIAIRENAKDDQEVEDTFWGRTLFSSNRLISTLSWSLFNLAHCVDDVTVASRFLGEFRNLGNLEESGMSPSDPGKSSLKLLHRLLCESRNSDVFAQPAFKITTTYLLSEDWWPFVSEIAKCILNPKRETTEWVADWTLTFTSSVFATGSTDWTQLVSLRKKLFDTLQSEEHKALHKRIWPLLTDSHHSLHYAHNSIKMSEAAHSEYHKVLIQDLLNCQSLLKPPRTLEEATLARPMWEWYLEYTHDVELVTHARECERLYSALSKWRIQDFFRFDYDEKLAPVTDRIAKRLREATEQSVFNEFFDEAELYLSVARSESGDTADDGRLGELANRLIDQLPLNFETNAQVLPSFVRSVLSKGEAANKLARSFTYALCQKKLGLLKSTNKNNVSEWLSQLLRIVPATEQTQLLWRLYANAHSAWTGKLTSHEVQCILNKRNQFNVKDWYWLIGIIHGSSDSDTSTTVEGELARLQDSGSDSTNCLWSFIRAFYTSCLRFSKPQTPSASDLNAIFNCIIKAQPNGTILKMHELKWLREKSQFKPDMSQFVSFVRSRIDLEGSPKPDSGFEILPYRFKVNEWCNYDLNALNDKNAFQELCELVLGTSFVAIHWIPEFLPDIAPNGESVASFISDYIPDKNKENEAVLPRLAYLASQYPADSEAWAVIARPVCEKANSLSREDREHVYFCLSRNETGVMTNMPGEVNRHYYNACDSAKRLLDAEPYDSPLRPYREWALKRAESELRFEQGHAEEMSNE